MGSPSVFLRTFGCNLKCESFGMPCGEQSNERNEVVITDDMHSIHDLPLVSTGCDSYGSWDVRFKHLSPTYTTAQLGDEICNIVPEETWDSRIHLVITGGEPLLGWQRAYPELLDHKRLGSLKHVTFETNGTQQLSDDFWEYMIRNRHAYTFSVSPKLSASGEERDIAFQPDIVGSYSDVVDAINDSHIYLKFVCDTKDHVEEVLDLLPEYKRHGFRGDVFIMPTGGMVDMYEGNRKEIAELCLKHKLKYSPRLHVDIWGNAWAT